MTGSERPSPEPIPKKEASPAVLGGEHSGKALEASNALNYRVFAKLHGKLPFGQCKLRLEPSIKPDSSLSLSR